MEKKRQRFIKISSLELAYDPEIPLLGRQRREQNWYVEDMPFATLLMQESPATQSVHQLIGKEEIKNVCVQKRTHRK